MKIKCAFTESEKDLIQYIKKIKLRKLSMRLSISPATSPPFLC